MFHQGEHRRSRRVTNENLFVLVCVFSFERFVWFFVCYITPQCAVRKVYFRRSMNKLKGLRGLFPDEEPKAHQLFEGKGKQPKEYSWKMSIKISNLNSSCSSPLFLAVEEKSTTDLLVLSTLTWVFKFFCGGITIDLFNLIEVTGGVSVLCRYQRC